ncbi:MAG TPA: alpha/beta hydrolase [Hanamia sp.]|nr:alpha/beta hydrolase [Hanamia sp.]
MNKSEIKMDLGDVSVAANLAQPKVPVAMVIFAHGSGSSHLSPRNNFVADVLNQNSITTLLADLLTPEEDEIYENRFNIDLLTDRLIRLTEKALEQFAFDDLPIGFFGASTGAASALDAAAFLGDTIKAVVSRGGRPDLAKNLKAVKAPTLLIVGSLDTDVIKLNKKAYDQLKCDRKIEIVDGASHLFEEPGTLNEVANLASSWFDLYLCNNMIEERAQ